jgi:hypothetical protein
MEGIEFKTDGLKKLLKAMKQNSRKVKIGIDDPVEASIGAAHEFGTSSLPQRSFLRMPLQLFLEKRLSARNDFSEASLKDVIRSQEYKPWLEKIATVAKEIVQEAFDTNGFGKWAPDKDMPHKKTKKILVETGSLRDSIVTEII